MTDSTPHPSPPEAQAFPAGALPDRLRRVARAARSGLRRYPREILDSVLLAGSAPTPIVPAADLDTFFRGDLGALWVGHASVLIRLGDAVVLTDPVFSERIGLSLAGVTVGLSRLALPALDVDHLPKIDAVLVSHAHFDHLDRPSLERLAAGPASGARVVTAAHTADLIPPGFSRVDELGWGASIDLGRLRVHAIRPRHWGARTALDTHRGFNAYVVDGFGRRVLFAGDTAATHAFDALDRVDLAVFGIGAYEPWDHAHASPEQVWSMYARFSRRARPRGAALLPMHHATFDLGEKHAGEPFERLLEAAGSARDRIVCPRVGSSWSVREGF